MGDSKKRKIAILGGGVGSLTTAYYLTSKPGWQDEYEVTLYQLGWRLGGKGATGRQGPNQRILEHGLHVWFGWYENAFTTLRATYKELNRAPGQPMATIEEAFTPRGGVQLMETMDDGKTWLPWNIDFPDRPGIPGEDEIHNFGWDVMISMLEFLEQWIDQHLESEKYDDPPHDEGILKKIGEAFERMGGKLADGALKSAIHAATALAKLHIPKRDEHGREQLEKHHHHHLGLIAASLAFIRGLIYRQVKGRLKTDTDVRRFWIGVDMAMTCLIGAINDGVFNDGLPAIDEWDFVEWLDRNGVSPEVRYSAPVRALYDCFFGFRDGHHEPTKENLCIAAGAGLGCALRIGLCYAGGVLYLMNAGMGEVIVAPVYQVLKRRGVKFEFFHRVKSIEADADGKRIERVKIGVQATPKSGEYDPLISVNGLPVWPNEPDFKQLVQGDDLRDKKINLESRWADWKDPDELVLEVGKNVDQVVCGIALSGLGEICKDLADKDPAWREMIDKIPSMQTFGTQLWLDEDLKELGWKGDLRSAVAAPEVLNVWADMSQTIQRENYKYDEMPRSVIYLCGPLAGDMMKRPPSDHGVPEEAWDSVYEISRKWLAEYSGWIWPASGKNPGDKALDLAKLFAPGASDDEQRLKQQFFRANIDPTERYVLSPPKWNKLRMFPGKSGFEGLFLAGDWTRTPINAGCVEAATMSGMECSRAICGFPEKIKGEHFMQG
ncbi:MAG: NAD(P)-binding protein [bacterium]|nr:NAD(P)-binding protein [bacterium]